MTNPTKKLAVPVEAYLEANAKAPGVDSMLVQGLIGMTQPTTKELQQYQDRVNHNLQAEKDAAESEDFD